MRKCMLALFGLCLLISFKLPEPVSALSCATPKPVKEEVAKSTLVFMGTAVNTNIAKYDMAVAFRVKTLWKGNPELIGKGIVVGDMWMEIKAGHDYLIFATQREGRLEANICGNSKLWSEVSQEQANELGKGEQILEQPVENRNLIYLFILGFLIVVIVPIAFYRSRRNRIRK